MTRIRPQNSIAVGVFAALLLAGLAVLVKLIDCRTLPGHPSLAFFAEATLAGGRYLALPSLAAYLVWRIGHWVHFRRRRRWLQNCGYGTLADEMDQVPADESDPEAEYETDAAQDSGQSARTMAAVLVALAIFSYILWGC